MSRVLEWFLIIGLAPLVIVAFIVLTPLVLVSRLFGYRGFVDDIGRSDRG